MLKGIDLGVLNKPDYVEEDGYFVIKHRLDLTNEEVRRDRKRIDITMFEQRLLRIIANQQILSLKQIHRLYSYFRPINRKYLRIKLNRWADNNILNAIKPYKDNVPGFGFVNLYTIGQAGLKTLARINQDDSWLELNPYAYKDKKNFTHVIGQQDAVVNIALQMFKHLSDDTELRSIPPYILFGEKKKEGIPDWFLSYQSEEGNTKNIYIEFDAGTEFAAEITKKIEAYIQRALDNPDEDIVVLFSLMDKEFHYRGWRMPSGPKRLSNFKSYCDHKYLPENLTLNVHYLGRSGIVTEDILIPKDKDERLNVLRNHFTNVHGLKVQEMLEDGLYLREVPKGHYADCIWELRNERDQLEERVAVIIAQEGDIRSYQRIDGFYKAMKGRLLTSTIHRLIILYNDDESSLSDSTGIEFDESVLLTNVESLENHDETPFREFKGTFTTREIAYPLENNVLIN